MRFALMLVLVLSIGCKRSDYTDCNDICQDLAALCQQAVASIEKDIPLQVAAATQCLDSYAKCRSACSGQ
jgi:hypothetical protein